MMGVENSLDAPAAVPTVEQLEENIIDRKMGNYDVNGLLSMDEIKKSPIEIIIGKIHLPELPTLGSIEHEMGNCLVHRMKNNTKMTAHLIKEDVSCYSLYLTHLVHPDGNGAHRASSKRITNHSLKLPV